MRSMTREFAAEPSPEPTAESTSNSHADGPKPLVDVWKRARARRNQCAVALAAIYILFSIFGVTFLRTPGQYAYRNAEIFQLTYILTGFAIVGLFIGFCCNGAKARGWSAWMGLLIAAFSLIIWLGTAVFILFQNANAPTSIVNAPRVYDDRAPFLAVIAFVVSTSALLVLPNRTKSCVDRTNS